MPPSTPILAMSKPALLHALDSKDILRLIDAAESGDDFEIEQAAKGLGVEPNELFWALDDYKFENSVATSDLYGASIDD